MDDETFKSEVLDRLQQIMEMLAAAILPEASIEETEEAPKPHAVPEPVQAGASYGILDEMQDDYRSALEKWNLKHGSA